MFPRGQQPNASLVFRNKADIQWGGGRRWLLPLPQHPAPLRVLNAASRWPGGGGLSPDSATKAWPPPHPHAQPRPGAERRRHGVWVRLAAGPGGGTQLFTEPVPLGAPPPTPSSEAAAAGSLRRWARGLRSPGPGRAGKLEVSLPCSSSNPQIAPLPPPQQWPGSGSISKAPGGGGAAHKGRSEQSFPSERAKASCPGDSGDASPPRPHPGSRLAAPPDPAHPA